MSDQTAIAEIPVSQHNLPAAFGDEQLIAHWLEQIASPHTRRAYAADKENFLAFIGGKALRRLSVVDVQQYATHLAGSGLSEGTQARRINTVKSLLSCGHTLGFLPFNAGAPVKPPKLAENLTARIMTDESAMRMLFAFDAPDSASPHVRVRNSAIIATLYYAGLRIAEAAGLEWADVSPITDGKLAGAARLRIVGKGRKVRVVVLPAKAACKLLALPRGEARTPVFASHKGGPMDASAIHRVVKQAAARAGLPAAVSAHWLRHAHASHSLDNGCPVHELQQTLGHASLATTTKYSHAKPETSSGLYL